MASPAKRDVFIDDEGQGQATILPPRASSDKTDDLVPALDPGMEQRLSRRSMAGAAVFELDPMRDSRWMSLVDSHPRSSVFHSQPWLHALRDVYGYRFVVATTCPPGEKLTNGLIFCGIDSWLTGRRLVSLPFSDHCEPLVDGTAGVDDLLLHLKQQVQAGRWSYLEIRPVACGPEKETELSRVVTYHLHSLDLTPTKDELFKNFHKDCIQRKIRRAEREQLKYEEGTSEELLREFYRLLVMTRRRQHLPPQPLAWFRALIAAFGNDLKIRMVSKDGVAIASILTISHKRSMVYKYGCSNVAFNNLGGTPSLFWRTIQEAKDRGFQELEMGRSDADNLGLVAFKERWGASRRSISYWTYPNKTAAKPGFWRKNVFPRVVSASPNFALEAIGSMLYKHIG
jgi:Acetyltransferase (GNAT) domain